MPGVLEPKVSDAQRKALADRYSLFIEGPDGRRTILEDELSARKVSNVAKKMKDCHGRRIVITRNQRVLPGGARALDKELYERWLEEHRSDAPGEGAGVGDTRQ